MGVIEKSIALTSKDGKGNQLLFLPYTKVDNVEGAVDEAQLQNYATTSQLPSVMTGASSTLAGSEGLVPAPAKGFQARFLRGDGTWQTPTDSKTQQTKKTDNNEYPILAKLTANETNATAGASFASGITINPSTGTITANTFNGTATKATVADAADSVNWSGVQNKPTIPTKVSQLTNDSGYLTEIPSDYVTESELELKNYATKQEIPTQYLKDVTVLNDKVTFSTNNLPKTITINNVAFAKQAGNMFWDGILDKPTIPTKTSDLSNDNNFITSSELEPYALTETVNSALMSKVDYGTLNNYVTKIELNNKGYLTSIPAEYITEIELNEKGFLTNIDLLPYAKTETVNQLLNQKVSTSEMINYVTYDSLSKQGFITEEELNSRNYLTSVPSEYITETELESKNYATMTQLSSKIDSTEVANKANKIPRLNSSGHYVFPNGAEMWVE